MNEESKGAVLAPPVTQAPLFAPPGERHVPARASEKTEMQRATAEVFAAHQRALSFPRDQAACEQEIYALCRDVDFASAALYKVPRGGTEAEGFNVHAAKEFARIWGNMESGVINHGDYGGITQLQAYAIDLERNYRHPVSFVVKHERKVGDKINPVTDPQQIKELCKAEASKEERNAILSVIPHHVKIKALKEVKRALHTSVTDIKQAWEASVQNFGKYGVKEPSLWRYVNKKPDRNPQFKHKELTASDIVDLRILWQTCKEEPAAMDEAFPERDKKAAAKEAPAEGSPKAVTKAPEVKKADGPKQAPPPASPAGSPGTERSTSEEPEETEFEIDENALAEAESAEIAWD